MRRVAAALAFVAAALAGCGDWGGKAAACEPVQHPEQQGGGHLIGDATPPVPYSSTPGTSGFHAAGQPATGVVSEPLTEPEIVTLLEAGQVVAAYDAEQLPASQARDLEELARRRLAGRVTVTPFDGDMRAPLTINAWGTRQACTRVDGAAVAGFVAEHARRGPQPP